MAQYEKVFTKPYEDGYEDLPSQNTPITASTLNDKDAAIEHIEDFLDGQEFPTAEEKAVWNDAQNLYKYTLLDQVAQINSNVSGVVPAIAMDDYSIGDYFVQQKKLCKAIAAISNGDDLIKNTNYVEVTVGDELGLKTDISAIGTDESGRTTASKAYAVGEHFYKDGKFCTAIASIASGATFTLNTNYVEGTIADYITNKDITNDLTWNTSGNTFAHNSASISGNVVTINVRFSATVVSANHVLVSIPDKYMPKSGWFFGNIVRSWYGTPISALIYKLSTTGQLYLPDVTTFETGVGYVGSFTYVV